MWYDKRMKKKFLFIILSLILFFPNTSSAVLCNENENGLNLCYPSFNKYTLTSTSNLSDIVAWFYYFIIGVSGFAAFIMIVSAGFKYFTSAGNPSAIGDAKDQIKSALLGLLLILTSYIILQTINPDLIILQEPTL